MHIAVTSQNFRTVTGHAGRARRFIIFEADGATPAKEVGRLDLDAQMAIHGYSSDAAHPLDGMDVLITGGAGGIGSAFGAAYVREGATVALADVNADGKSDLGKRRLQSRSQRSRRRR